LVEQATMEGRTNKLCPDCGAELHPEAEICTRCGYIQSATISPIKGEKAPPPQPHQFKEKNPIIAIVLTLIFMPLGYWYIKRLKRWAIVFFVTLVMAVLVGEWGAYIMAMIAVYDTYRLAKNKSAPFDFLGRWGLA
jgi:hypothetical protein